MKEKKCAEKREIKEAFPIMIAVFISFIVVGMALPVLPLHVHNVLRFGPFVVGLVAGCQFVAALISRIWAGKLADTRGARYALFSGIIAGILGGTFYALSLFFLQRHVISVLLLLIGRTILGASESLIITGGILWSLQLVNEEQSAKVMSWVGMSLFAGLAVGAPVGSYIFNNYNFMGIAIATIAMPFFTFLLVKKVRIFISDKCSESYGIFAVFKSVFLPGFGFALSGITFGTITTFLTLFFSIKNWEHGTFAFALFAIMLIITRIFFGHFPDKFGGAKVSIFCLIIQGIGLIFVGIASTDWFAIFGVALSGFGFALVFPALGLEAIKSVPEKNRGLAMGIYNGFLDITLGFGSPLLGFFAGKYGLGFVFILSAVLAILAIPISVILIISKYNNSYKKIAGVVQ